MRRLKCTKGEGAGVRVRRVRRMKTEGESGGVKGEKGKGEG